MSEIMLTLFHVDRHFYDLVYGASFFADALPAMNDIKQQRLYCRLLQLNLVVLFEKRSRDIPPIQSSKIKIADEVIFLNVDNIYHALSLTAGLISQDISKGIEKELAEYIRDIISIIFNEMRMQMVDYDPYEMWDD
ncbi:TPA: hypothetical protein ACHIF3_002434 [Escherichia coli]